MLWELCISQVGSSLQMWGRDLLPSGSWAWVLWINSLPDWFSDCLIICSPLCWFEFFGFCHIMHLRVSPAWFCGFLSEIFYMLIYSVNIYLEEMHVQDHLFYQPISTVEFTMSVSCFSIILCYVPIHLKKIIHLRADVDSDIYYLASISSCYVHLLWSFPVLGSHCISELWHLPVFLRKYLLFSEL